MAQIGPESIKQIAQAVRVYSLSRRRDSALMWSHYAAAHKGLCLGFNAAISPFCTAKKIIYESSRSRYNMMEPNFRAKLFDIYLQKSSDWEYKNEYRMILPQELGSKFLYPNGALKEVIFGLRMPEEDKKIVRAWAAKHNPKFLQAKVSDNSFSVDIGPAE